MLRAFSYKFEEDRCKFLVNMNALNFKLRKNVDNEKSKNYGEDLKPDFILKDWCSFGN
jgi:hypothetical protein